MKPGDTIYTPLPLFHGNALLVSFIGSMLLDAKFALAERFSASRFWDDCRKYEAVEFNTLGGMISILLKQPEKPNDADNPVRTVLSAAAPPDRWREFEQRFGVKIVEFYGMVDSPGFLLNADGKVGSMGKPIASIDFAIMDDDGQPLPDGQVGEICFRHPLGQTTHYHKLPDATAEAYRGGWFHSGDLGVIDDEGWWYYKGRKKESMRRLGENISAWEIETVINQHPEVLECGAHAVGPNSARTRSRSSSCPSPAPRRRRSRSSTSAGGRWPTTPFPATWSSSTPCPRRRPTASSTPLSRPRASPPIRGTGKRSGTRWRRCRTTQGGSGMRDVFIAGTGMTAFGKFMDSSVR